MKRLSLAFVGFLVAGTLGFLVTGSDVLLGLAMEGAIAIALFWSAWIAIRNIRGHLKKQLYIDAAMTGALHVGILFLLIYFCWFILSEMVGVRALGPVPEVNNSRLTLVGAALILLTLVILFARALARKREPRRPRGD
jgi:hypothetical protein